MRKGKAKGAMFSFLDSCMENSIHYREFKTWIGRAFWRNFYGM